MPSLVQPTRISYDPEADVFSVSFGSPTRATGYEVCDQILLRVNPTSGQVAGVTIRRFLGIAQDERGARATIIQPPLVEAVAA